MDDLLFHSAAEIAAAIRNRTISAIEVVEMHLRQIERVNDDLNAVVCLTAEQALDAAKQADNRSLDDELPPLYGVPITLKDSIDTAGVVTTYGTTGRRDFVPERNATVAERLLDAGAILLGKTNTPEFTLGGEIDNPVYGKTFNPYNLTHTPGSSSGGSAAIVAAGGAALDLGSDTGGSIREPANFCGLAGIKPTSGRVSRMGHALPFGCGLGDSLTTIGPLARSVDDLELALHLIAGPDGIDYTVSPTELKSSKTALAKPLRIAYYTDGNLGVLNEPIGQMVKDVATLFAEDGHSVVESIPDGVAMAAGVFSDLLNVDGAAWLRGLLAKAGTDRPGPNLAKILKAAISAETPSTTTILKNLTNLRSAAWQWMQSFDAIICPVQPYAALPHGDVLQLDGTTAAAWSHMNFYNLTGWPAGVVRASTTSDGLPVGVQIVARPWREDVVLAMLKKIEIAFGGYQRPSLDFAV